MGPMGRKGRGKSATSTRPARERAPTVGRSSVILIGAITLAVLLPFLNKALHIDDPLFVWTAQQIRRSPLDFYGFEVNWYGHPEPMADVTQNPPGAAYFLALAGAMFGWSERALHAAYLIPALGVSIGTLFLARRFGADPRLAGFCAVATPLFTLSATVLTSDIVMLALWIWAVELWLRAHERDSRVAFLASSLLVCAAALTKYFALALIPLLGVDAWLRGRRRAMLWMLVPLGGMGLYELVTRSLYGHGLLSQAGGYTRHIAELDRATAIEPLGKALVGLAFLGGCVFVVLPLAPWLWSRRQLAVGALVALCGASIAGSAEELYGYPMRDADGLKWWIVVHLFFFLAAALAALGLPAARLLRARSADSLLLALWVLGTVVFASLLNWTVNGRSFLPALPAVVILLALRVDRDGPRPRGPALRVALASALLVAIGVAWADLRHADTAREAAALSSAYDGGATDHIWYQGHWGFQWYMELHGARALDLGQPVLWRGDFAVLPENSTAVREMPRQGVQLLDRIELPTATWISTMSPFDGTGYYAARKRGPLPFALRRTTPERYYVYRVIRNINPPQGQP